MVRKVVRILPTGLMVRSGVYYFRIDARGTDGKYKSVRHSLRTKDLEQAIQVVEYIKNFMKTYKDLTTAERADFIKWYTRSNSFLDPSIYCNFIMFCKLLNFKVLMFTCLLV